MADISPILTPLTYREMLGAKCGEPNMAVKSAFMTDLKAAGATETLMTEAGAEAGRIEAAERDTPNEYVCTAELYESTEENADAAQKAWAELKNRNLQTSGRKEVLMLVPVVFFILPIVVVIALYPGLHGLQLTVS